MKLFPVLALASGAILSLSHGAPQSAIFDGLRADRLENSADGGLCSSLFAGDSAAKSGDTFKTIPSSNLVKRDLTIHASNGHYPHTASCSGRGRGRRGPGQTPLPPPPPPPTAANTTTS